MPASPWLDALLGGIYSAGSKIAFSAGLNFKNGLSASFNTTTKLIDVVAAADQPQAVALAPFLAGAGVAVRGGLLAQQLRPRLLRFEERFIGSVVSPNIGTHGWTQTGTGSFSCSTQLNATGSVPKLRITTDVNLNDHTAVHLGTDASRSVMPASHGIMRRSQFYVSATALTARRAFVGFSTDFAADTPVDALGFLYDSSLSANWQIWARSASTGAPVVSMFPVVTAGTILSIDESAAGFSFYANSTLLGELTSNLPTGGKNLGFSVKTLAASAGSFECAYVGVDAELSGWDLDMQLEGAQV